MNNYEDSSSRSIIKTITWRIFATLTTIAIAYIITGELDLAKKIGAIEFVSKMVIYYFHERIWNYIPFGKIRESKK